MELSVREENTISVVDVIGEIDLYEAPLFTELISELIDKGTRKFLVNLEKVNYVDSSGIGALILNENTVSEAGGLFKLANVTANVAKIFEVTKLDIHFQIFPNVDEGIKSFG
jgi:anti-sigma B factor antagonist